MDQREFEADLRRENYQVFYGGNRAGESVGEHSHPFDARLYIIGGEFTLGRNGQVEVLRAGDTCIVPANQTHTELTGPQGVALIIGRRTV